MSSILILLGLKTDPSDPLIAPPNLAPYYALFNFFFSYMILSARFTKRRLRIDHNVNPRLDLAKYGERAVAQGKMTKRELNFLQRNESCHANSMEHFGPFACAAIFATVAGVDAAAINTRCVAYTASRIVYVIAYLVIEREELTGLRSLAWWGSSITCISLFWSAGKALNAGKI